MNLKTIFLIIKSLSLIGIILALYLLWQQFFHPSFQPCSINATINCEAIISGAVAKTFGIPTPLFGLVGYLVIFFAALRRKKRLLLSMATFGLGFCLWIAYRELFELHVICPICILCQTIMLSVFSLGIVVNRRENDNK